MEALWMVEKKLNIKTHEAVLLLFCMVTVVIGLCAAAILKRKTERDGTTSRQVKEKQRAAADQLVGCGWASVKRALVGSVRWSGATRWGEVQLLPPESSQRWRSHGSASRPVWQRPILMGEKCELPRFSGLILYDERGRLLDRPAALMGDNETHQLEKTASGVRRTTLRDLL